MILQNGELVPEKGHRDDAEMMFRYQANLVGFNSFVWYCNRQIDKIISWKETARLVEKQWGINYAAGTIQKLLRSGN